MEQLPFITDLILITLIGVIVFHLTKQNNAWHNMLERHREWGAHEINILRTRIKHLESDVYILLEKLQKKSEERNVNQAQAKQPTVSRKPRKVKQ